MKRILPVLLLLLFGLTNTYAGHSLGFRIEYQAIDTFKFEVQVIVYRDCRGVAFINPSSNFQLKCATTGTTRGVSLSLRSIQEVTQADSLPYGCNPSNTYGTGEGVERHIYVDTVDFNDSLYLPLKSCCQIRIEGTLCCRNSAINTGGANANNYSYALLDLCKSNNNSSPSLSFEPLAIQCCNQPVFANFGFKDTFDFDSMSYSFAQPLSAYGSNVSYSGSGYSYQSPFQVYYPGSLTYPYYNPVASPPIGIYLDPLTGDLIYTPTRCDEVTVAVIEVKEWRKDTSGTYQLIGMVRNDVMYITKSCPDNNPPEIDGPYSYNVCAGEQLCFNISTDDNVFVPPPPASTPPPDTTKMWWNHGIPDASFEIVNDSARLKTGRFCWTPTDEDVRTRPYQFAVEVRDNAVPLNAAARRSFRVRVKPRAYADIQLTKKACGFYEVSSQPQSGFVGTPSYRWEVLDSSGTLIVDPNKVYFESTGSFISVSADDSVRFNEPGTYIVKHTINNSPSNCPSIAYDTIQIGTEFQVELSVNDTSVCHGDQLTIESAARYGQTPFVYQWIVNNDTLTNQLTHKLNTNMNAGDSTYHYILNIWDANGCEAKQEVRITTYPEFQSTLEDTSFTCFDSLDLNVGSTFNSVLWSTSESDSMITVIAGGNYSVQLIDSNGCAQSDSIYANFLPDPVSELRDTTLCSHKVLLDAGEFESYDWSNGDTGRTSEIRSTGTYYVTIEDGFGCFGTDTVQVVLNSKPEVNLPNNLALCCNSEPQALNDLLGPNDSLGGSWINYSYPLSVINDSFYAEQQCNTTSTFAFISYTYQHPITGCIGSDSIGITVNPLPLVDVRSKGYCKSIGSIDLGKELVQRPGNPYLGEFGWSCKECNGNDFQDMVVDEGTMTFPAYFLYFNDDVYTMLNEEIDTISLIYTFTNAFGCSNTDQADIYIYDTPAAPNLTRVDDTLYSNVSGVIWYRNDTLLDGRTSDTLIMNRPGDYKAKKTSDQGCGESDFSFTHTRLANLFSFEELGLKMYPVPTNGQLTIENESGVQIEGVVLRNAEGKAVNCAVERAPKGVEIEFNAPVGFYILEITTDRGVAQEKILHYGQW